MITLRTGSLDDAHRLLMDAARDAAEIDPRAAYQLVGEAAKAGGFSGNQAWLTAAGDLALSFPEPGDDASRIIRRAVIGIGKLMGGDPAGALGRDPRGAGGRRADRRPRAHGVRDRGRLADGRRGPVVAAARSGRAHGPRAHDDRHPADLPAAALRGRLRRRAPREVPPRRPTRARASHARPGRRRSSPPTSPTQPVRPQCAAMPRASRPRRARRAHSPASTGSARSSRSPPTPQRCTTSAWAATKPPAKGSPASLTPHWRHTGRAMPARSRSTSTATPTRWPRSLELEQLAGALQRPWADGLLERARGLTTTAKGDRHFQRAVALHGDQRPFECARTELAYGETLRRTRRRMDARAPLHRALRDVRAHRHRAVGRARRARAARDRRDREPSRRVRRSSS